MPRAVAVQAGGRNVFRGIRAAFASWREVFRCAAEQSCLSQRDSLLQSELIGTALPHWRSAIEAPAGLSDVGGVAFVLDRF